MSGGSEWKAVQSWHCFPLRMSVSVAPSATASKLRSLRDRIAVLRYPDETLLSLVVYDLPAAFRESSISSSECERRIHYYDRLAGGEAYPALISTADALLRKVHQAIDLTRIPKALQNPPDSYYKGARERLDAEVASLLNPPRLQDNEPTTGRIDEWRYVLAFYTEKAENTMWRLVSVRAITEEEMSGFLQQWKPIKARLIELLEKPWQEDRLEDFMLLSRFVADRSDQQSALQLKEYYQRVQQSSCSVCEELLKLPALGGGVAASTESTGKGRRGRKARVSYDPATKTFSFRKKSYKVSKNADYAELCDAFYPNCPTSDNLPWKRVHKLVHAVESKSPIEDREKMRGKIRSLNRWAKSPRHFLGELLRLKNEHVERLK